MAPFGAWIGDRDLRHPRTNTSLIGNPQRTQWVRAAPFHVARTSG
jgi:hypothetical protein